MEKFMKIYSDLFKDNTEDLLELMEQIVIKLEPPKIEMYKRNVKYIIKEYLMGIIEIISNNTSWRKYIGKINGRVLNNKHNCYSKMGVYEELYKINLQKYLVKANGKTVKNLSIDSSFVNNKYGTEELGRNIYYRNKRGRKITAIVDSKGIPLNIIITSGNIHDAKIAPTILNVIEKNIHEIPKYILADKAYDSEKIRELIRKKNYKPIIPRRMSRKNKTKKKSLKQTEISRYKKRIIVENFFAWIKAYPKVNCIYEKSKLSYLGVLLLSMSILIYKRMSKM